MEEDLELMSIAENINIQMKKLKEINVKNAIIISNCDKKEQDLLHHIELDTLKAYQRINLMTEFKKVRIERRIAKNNCEKVNYIITNILNIYKGSKILNVELEKFETISLKNKKYGNRFYKKEEFEQIIG